MSVCICKEGLWVGTGPQDRLACLLQHTVQVSVLCMKKAQAETHFTEAL